MIVYVATGPTGKKYVGITVATLEKRMSEHKREADNGRDYKFYRALRKYGFDSFQWEIVQRCESADSLKAAEVRWIATLNSKYKGYNTTFGGQGAAGRRMNEKQRQEHSARQKRRFENPEQRAMTAKRVSEWKQRDPLGFEVALTTRINTIRSQANRERASRKAKEFAQNNPDAMKANSERQKQLMTNEARRLEISRSLGGKRIEATKNGKTIIFETLRSAARELGLSSGTIGMVLSGRRNHTGGYTFRRIGIETSCTNPADFESRNCEALADSALCGFGWTSLARIGVSNPAQMLESAG